MTKNCRSTQVLLFNIALISILLSACGKSSNPTPVASPLVTLGLYQYQSTTGNDRRIYIPVTQVGTQKISSYCVFDTGSSGMVIDGKEVLPSNDISTSGVNFVGDSLVVNGITVTKQAGTIQYGNQISGTTAYGYLAYAAVTIGDQNGSITTKRMPFFLYYKAIDQNNNTLAVGELDVFGVGAGVSYAVSTINSPLLYFNFPSGITSGFKLATLNNTYFNGNYNGSLYYVSNLLTLGLTAADLSSSSGFIMHQLNYFTVGGYSSNIPSTITYTNGSTNSSTTFSGQILFDTGTPSVAIIEDKNATNTIGILPASSTVSITTNQGFKYQYTTSGAANVTEVQNPNNTGDTRTIMAIDFFIKNEFLTDYTDHLIGLKNN